MSNQIASNTHKLNNNNVCKHTITAFLQVPIPETDRVFVELPPGFRWYDGQKPEGQHVNPRKWVARLAKALYGQS